MSGTGNGSQQQSGKRSDSTMGGDGEDDDGDNRW